VLINVMQKVAIHTFVRSFDFVYRGLDIMILHVEYDLDTGMY